MMENYDNDDEMEVMDDMPVKGNMSDDELLGIIANEMRLTNKENEIAGGELEDALKYYLGEPNGTEIEGRSQVTSTDVADTIEWIMPQVMKSLTEKNEIVVFDAVAEGDEKQAELESQYVYDILMKQNDGFIIIYQLVKDALMQRNGILKVYYAEKNCYKVSTHTGLNETQLSQLLENDDIDVLESSEYVDQDLTDNKNKLISDQINQLQSMAQQNESAKAQIGQHISKLTQELQTPVMLYDVKIVVNRVKGQIYIDPVPPEEFRVNNNHNSICLDEPRFTAQTLQVPICELLEDGLIESVEEGQDLPADGQSYIKTYRFITQDKDSNGDHDRVDTGDDSQELVDIAECYMKLDYDKSGYARKYKVTVAGWETPTHVLSVEEIDKFPWIATTPFIMSHKFEGLSIYDRIKEIQKQKTAIWRNIMDNLYQHNNQRLKVIPSQVNMDDVMVSRPQGILRVKRMDAVEPLVTPGLSSDVYKMMDYIDQIRAGRSGVDADGNAAPHKIGDGVGSEGVDRMMTAKEELVGLIIRVFAETGIKPLCIKIRDLCIQHIDAVQDYRFRGVWHKINPASWEERVSTTVRIGTGTGDKRLKLGAIREVLAIQEKMLANPNQTLVNEEKVFATVDDLCKFSGLSSANRYFVDPSSPQGKQSAQNKQRMSQMNQQKQDMLEQKMAAAQEQIAKAETMKAEAQALTARSRAQIEGMKIQLQSAEAGHKAELEELRHNLEEMTKIAEQMEASAQQELDKYQADLKAAVELTKSESESGNYDLENEFSENMGIINGFERL